jgi:uncharacterized protein (TIGR01777 family)
MNENLAGQRIVVTGASGLIGSRLVSELQQAGAQVIRAVRRPVEDQAREMFWDPDNGKIDAPRLEGVDAVVHLAGENIAGHRWTESFKQKIRDSRVNGTRLVSEAIAGLAAKPQAFVCASAIGYYGDRGDEALSETSPPADDFLARTCRDWEAACQVAAATVRVVNLRTGVVLSPEGGALKKMLTPFKLGAGGKMGDGRQYMSWIALDDEVAAIQFILTNPNIGGPVNLVAPNPVTNAEFTKTLGRVLSRPTIIPMPAFAARLLFGEMADALLLASTRVVPQALTASGYHFRYAELEPALRHLLGR